MSLRVKGISLQVDEVTEEVAAHDLRAIREELCCTDVILIGMDLPKLFTAAHNALMVGLNVWIEPHPVDISRRKVLRNLEIAALAAEQLRRGFPGRVNLVVGCEFSLHLAGMIPGRPEAMRLLVTIHLRRRFRKRIDRKVNRLLGKALARVKPVFGGPVTYAAASWENVDWSDFDYAGVNLYRTAANSAQFEEKLRERLDRAGKPLLITEFGCGAYVGGAQRGPGSFKIVNWLSVPPKIRKGNIRSERVQAAYVGDMIDVYARNEVHGCFVYTFALRDYPHFADPLRDLDMASFSVVKIDPDDLAKWEPKAAFHEIARRYAGPEAVPEAVTGRRSGDGDRASIE
ncbi:hypothetical protein [Amycolatopsis samaneae]|uniref:Abortive infection protein n=1 Tax=Amycolatopsis samaneae TaxID=664691 RepID=A0ABW5GGC2_9PSEU